MQVIGDELTVTGFRLAGMKKAIKADEDSVSQLLMDSQGSGDIILITQSLARHAQREIEMIRRKGIVLIEIPDRGGIGGEDIMQKLVKEAVGFDLKT
jgi:vacuolar-type H+-ATPase subunit F/Vma7